MTTQQIFGTICPHWFRGVRGRVGAPPAHGVLSLKLISYFFILIPFLSGPIYYI